MDQPKLSEPPSLKQYILVKITHKSGTQCKKQQLILKQTEKLSSNTHPATK